MKNINDKRLRLFQRPKVRLTLLSSENEFLITKEFGKLIDLESGCWAAVLGHSKNIIQEAICSLEFPAHTHQFFDTSISNRLIEAIETCAGLPTLYVGTFMTSGTEAVSLAVMLSELLTGRRKKLSLSISYLGASPELRIPRDSDIWTDFNPSKCMNCSSDKNCNLCEKFDSIDFAEYASFIFEPGNSGGVIIFPPEKLINFISSQIRSNGGMLIANEVTTGVGRTGKFFGYQYYQMLNTTEISPDFIAMGKCLGNGYPISGVLVKSTLQTTLEKSSFRYVQSHSDDPLGISVALKTIEVIQSQNLIEESFSKGNYLRDLLLESKSLSKAIKEVRGKGLMNIIALQQNNNATEVFIKLLNKGFFVGYSEVHNLLRLYPPLTIKKETLFNFCKTLEEIICS